MCILPAVTLIVALSPAPPGQQQFVADTKPASEDELRQIRSKLVELDAAIAKLREQNVQAPGE